MTETVRTEVREALKAASRPLNFDELLAACHTVMENKQLSNALFQLKKWGEVVSPKRGLYEIPRCVRCDTRLEHAGGIGPYCPNKSCDADDDQRSDATEPLGRCGRCGAPLTDGPPCSCTKPAASTTPAPAAPATPESLLCEKVEEILQQLVDDTQGALDEYLVSIADPAILKPLQAARDNARAALKAHLKLDFTVTGSFSTAEDLVDHLRRLK